LGWLKNVCGIALPTSGELDEEINLNGLEIVFYIFHFLFPFQ